MMLLGMKDKNMIAHLRGTIGIEYTHHDIQNKLLNIMPRNILLSKLKTIRKKKMFFNNVR